MTKNFIHFAFSIIFITALSISDAAELTDHKTALSAGRAAPVLTEKEHSASALPPLEEVQIAATNPPPQQLVTYAPETHRRGFWYNFLPARLFDWLWPAPKQTPPATHPFFIYPHGYVPLLAVQIFITKQWMDAHQSQATSLANLWKPKANTDFFKQWFLQILTIDSMESTTLPVALSAGKIVPPGEEEKLTSSPLEQVEHDVAEIKESDLLDEPQKLANLRRLHATLGAKLGQADELLRQKKGQEEGVSKEREDHPSAAATSSMIPPSSQSYPVGIPPSGQAAPHPLKLEASPDALISPLASPTRQRGESAGEPSTRPRGISSLPPFVGDPVAALQPRYTAEKIGADLWELINQNAAIAKAVTPHILQESDQSVISIFNHNEVKKEIRLSINSKRGTALIKY
ncbi:MAG: hypothetical protein FJX71_00630 [Alphaproteobacteria bacterium]|nr:hypothetical protein [Alphaproteobacteria bacterium]